MDIINLLSGSQSHPISCAISWAKQLVSRVSIIFDEERSIFVLHPGKSEEKKHEIHGDLRRIDVIYDRNVGLNLIQVVYGRYIRIYDIDSIVNVGLFMNQLRTGGITL